MICPKCNAENTVGTFCNSCGSQLNSSLESTTSDLAEVTQPSNEANPPKKGKAKQIVIGSVAIAAVIAAVGVYSLTKESPAAPQLRELCKILDPIDFAQTNTDNKGDLLDKIEPILIQANDADSEAAQPFNEINSIIKKAKLDSDRTNNKMAQYLVFGETSDLLEANELLDSVIAAGEKAEVDIDIACSNYGS